MADVHQAEALDLSQRPIFGRRRLIIARKYAFQETDTFSSPTITAEVFSNMGVFVQLGVNQTATRKIGMPFALPSLGPCFGRSIKTFLLGLMLKGIYRSPIRRKFQCETHLIFHIKSVPGR